MLRTDQHAAGYAVKTVFIVVPQLLLATVMGTIMQAFFPGEPVWTMLFAAASWLVAALAMQRVRAVL